MPESPQLPRQTTRLESRTSCPVATTLEDLDTEKYDLYAHQNEDIVRMTPDQLKQRMAEKEMTGCRLEGDPHGRHATHPLPRDPDPPHTSPAPWQRNNRCRFVESIDDSVLAEIRAALLENLVIFFRDQNMTPATLLDFAKRWGPIHKHLFIAGMPDYPEVLQLVKKPSDKRNFGGDWHTDQMFAPEPALGTMLWASEVPQAGGDTMPLSMISPTTNRYPTA